MTLFALSVENRHLENIKDRRVGIHLNLKKFRTLRKVTFDTCVCLLLTRAFVFVYFQDCVQLFSHPVPSNHDRDWTHGHRRSSETTTTTDPTRARSCSFGRGQRPIAAHACLRNVKSFLLNFITRGLPVFREKLSECRRKVTFKYKRQIYSNNSILGIIWW